MIRTKFKYEVGDKFGKWTVTGEPFVKGSGYVHFPCLCECGTERAVVASNLHRGISTNCGCVKRSQPAHNYAGVGNLSMKYFTRLRKGAEDRGLEFNVTIEYLHSIFTGKCALSGLEIYLDRNTERQTASVDRIDSSKGYTEDNVQWVLQEINIMKRDFDQDVFIYLCKLVAAGGCEVK